MLYSKFLLNLLHLVTVDIILYFIIVDTRLYLVIVDAIQHIVIIYTILYLVILEKFLKFLYGSEVTECLLPEPKQVMRYCYEALVYLSPLRQDDFTVLWDATSLSDLFYRHSFDTDR